MPVSQMPEQISAKSDPALISFTEQDLALFSDASGDRNPLHLSEEYARGTPYGQRVVFGCLGAMACLGQIRLPAGWSVTSLDARFHLPIFLGVQYRVETTRNVDRWEGRLFDGSTVVLSLRMTAKLFKTTEIPNQARPACAFQRRDAAERPQDSIVPGLKVSGTYGCNPAALATLSERWGVRDGFLPAVLSWGSYLVGMELPGESALFSRFVLRFHGTAPSFAAAAYGASVSSVERGFGLVEAQVCLLDGASTVASGQCWSYIRSPVPEVEKINSSGVRRTVWRAVWQ